MQQTLLSVTVVSVQRKSKQLKFLYHQYRAKSSLLELNRYQVRQDKEKEKNLKPQFCL